LQCIDENVMQIICITNNYKMLLCINMTKKYLGWFFGTSHDDVSRCRPPYSARIRQKINEL